MQLVTGKPIHRILVVRQGGMGDFILTLPLFDALRRRWPKAAIDILGNGHHAQIAIDTGRAAACYDPDAVAFSSLFSASEPSRLDRRAFEFLARYDLVVSFQCDREGLVERNLSGLGVGVVFIPPAEDSDTHAASQFLRPLEEHDISVELETPPLPLPKHFQELAARKLASLGLTPDKPFIVIHPGSGSLRKNWPARNIASVLQVLNQDRRVSVLLTRGEADDSAYEALEQCVSLVPFPCLKGLQLMHLAAILQRAAAFLGNDTGVSHLAAAVGTPALVLFGPTSPIVWKPLGRNVETLTFSAATPAVVASRLLELAIQQTGNYPSQS